MVGCPMQPGWIGELWNQWLNFIVVENNVCLVVNYLAHFGVPMQNSITTMPMTLIPGVGCDAQLGKDWLFIGIAFRTMHTAGTKAWVACTIGVLSIATIFIPTVALVTKEIYRKHPELAFNFIASHWPAVGALPKQELNDITDAKTAEAVSIPTRVAHLLSQENLRKESVCALINASTPWHWEVAMGSEVPQAALEVLFGLVFQFHPGVLIALASSVCKIASIPLIQQRLPSMLRNLGDPVALHKYATANGLTSQEVLNVIFGPAIADWTFARSRIKAADAIDARMAVARSDLEKARIKETEQIAFDIKKNMADARSEKMA